MARKWANFFDTGSLNAVGTSNETLTLGSAPVGAVNGDTYRLVLDPLAEFGAPEIVDWEFTSGSSGTMTARGAEATGIRAHDAGTRVINSMTVEHPDLVDNFSIASGSITQPKMATNSVGSPELINGSVTGAHIAPGAVWSGVPIDTPQLAANSVTAGEIANDAVTAGEIAPNAVTASELSGASVGAFITTRSATNNVSVGLTSSFSDVASFTFNKPAGWGSYEALIQGWTLATSGTGGLLEVRVRLGGNNGPQISFDSTGDTTLVPGSDRFTGVTINNVAAIQARDTTGGDGISGHAVVTGIFIRTS